MYPNVANTWATIAGLYLRMGAVTLVPIVILSVFANAAPSQGHVAPDFAPVSHQGIKWSLVQHLFRPYFSIVITSSSKSVGANCSCDAIMLTLTIFLYCIRLDATNILTI